MPDFLLELMSEEIPARLQPAAARQLRDRFLALLTEARLAARTVEAEGGPRRLVLQVQGLAASSAAHVEERRGPRVGASQAAVEGFLRSAGVGPDALEERDTEKGRFLFAVVHHPGRPAADVLAERLPALLEAFDWSKSMRFEASGFRWIRPLRAIVALLDDAVVAFEVAGVRSGQVTYGHRTMAQGRTVVIAHPTAYLDQMAQAYVLVKADERRARIRRGARRVAAAAGFTLVEDEELVAENAGLAEWPVPLLGRFDPGFLGLPPELLTLTLKSHQKCFVVHDAGGALGPAFVCVANLDAPDGGARIVKGYERVIAARLADARFFWEQDLKVPLDVRAQHLTQVLFHDRLGTMAEKAARVARLARWLVDTHPGQFPGATAGLVERAALLARADLVTGTVGEFPELQGVIGAHLARAQGEPEAVVDCLRQFHAPVVEGAVPAAVTIADRLDTLVAFFSVGLEPTGSRDPFALRRVAQGLLDTLLANGIRLPIGPALVAAGDRPGSGVRDFLLDRLKTRLREEGVRHDVIEAVFAQGAEDDPVRLVARVRALQALSGSADGESLLKAFRRAANILKAEEARDGPHDGPVEPDRLVEPAEAALVAALEAAQPAVRSAVASEDFAAAMARLAALRPQIDRFFDEVTVNAGDPALRRNRLAVLAQFRSTAGLVADFSRIEG
ncbi:MAG: glycine--tRNA ligase subunit beta [Sphingomonadaceae bacterium]|uniref:glycine--tRNA ligase subunit beta n=1 Tax=Thermaurantiacus sp. TaxID=2820283 RepID=UPI00298F1A95|nr:glycine--tRNA ligase subunit beta [Thermaurantiacus sp.]MCS6987867.1 glycine--tRNA ligase subunit beta [Sphingomonadaceae bacterium]MDW8414913.1 glycine--tRNA ligase subunit beta [Thermaurantiacus sp.]